MRELEGRFSEELAVIGVHSGKFIAERETARIADAARRLGVAHPVVNDRQFRVWRGYAVRAWPTIVVIDPEGYVVGMHAGEFTAGMVAPAIERIVADAGATLRRSSAAPAADAREPRALRYPGKVAVAGKRIAIADSGNDRVLVGELDGARARITCVFGATRGFRDGGEPLFDHPQGLLFDGDALLVADAFNHAIREIDLISGRTRTIAGTGKQLRTRADERTGALSSPWDLARAGDRVAIAMAGNHRLYMLDRTAARARAIAGSGAEELHDGPIADAALAQPMGICADERRIWFADAESSAVRVADVEAEGSVATLVGTGLFDFGDVDGEGEEVRLQHPQGILRMADGRLLVVDTYNDALKWLEPASRRVTTWVRGLHEPGGAALGDGVVYVADTNAHRIAIVSLDDGTVGTLSLDWGTAGS
ncbi:MAG TPA: alkyl hydroperoxide reductase [Gemmatimonadaceae bacterium]|nr:alkyl hydroperoxide reductase [Gemmatimonadaceae bacterium]